MKIFRLFVAFTFVCFALSHRAQGVVPPPPGGYPNFTTAAGDHALQALTSGLGNTALGTFSLFSVTAGSFNTAVGAGSLDLNTADANTATGAAALLFNTTGDNNTANGTAALEFNDTGEFNDAVGASALFNNVSGFGNNAFGDSALFSNVIGVENTALGDVALAFNDSDGMGLANNNTAAAVQRCSIILMAFRTQSWVQGQDKTWSLATITLTWANSLVPPSATSRVTGSGPQSASSVVSSTTSSLLTAPPLFKLLWTLQTTTLALILARARLLVGCVAYLLVAHL